MMARYCTEQHSNHPFRQTEVVHGIRVHPITSKRYRLIVFGIRELTVCEFNEHKLLRQRHFPLFHFRILDVLVSSQNVVLVFDQGEYRVFSLDLIMDEEAKYEMKSIVDVPICYSGRVFSLGCLFGLVFGDILCFSFETEKANRFKVHVGPIFAIDTLDKEEGIMLVASCGNDRKVVLSEVTMSDSDFKVHEIFSVLGHDSRIWMVKLHEHLGDLFLCSVGEDRRINFFDFEGRKIRSITAHCDLNIFVLQLFSYNEKVFAVTGGSDGSVLQHEVSFFDTRTVTTGERFKVHEFQKEAIATVHFLPGGKILLSTTNGRLLLLGSTDSFQTWKEILRLENDGSQALAIDTTDKVLILATKSGSLFFYSFGESFEFSLVKEFGVNQRISFCFIENGLICASLVDSSLVTWEYAKEENVINIVLKKSLVGSKYEALPGQVISMAMVDEVLIFGDIRGNLHLALLSEDIDFEVVYRDLHNYQKISCIEKHGAFLYSAGHSGYCLEHKLLKKDGEVYLLTLRCIKEPTLSSIFDILFVEDEMFFGGFRNDEYFIVDIKSRKEVLKEHVGSWRRPFALHFDKISYRCAFVYVPPVSQQGEALSVSVKEASLRNAEIVSKFCGGMVIWASKFVNENVIISGDERGHLLFYRCSDLFNKVLDCIPCTIRDLDVARVTNTKFSVGLRNKRRDDEKQYIILGGGGFNSVNLWYLILSSDDQIVHFENIARYYSSKGSYSQRITGVSLVVQGSKVSCICGDSEGNVSVFEVVENKKYFPSPKDTNSSSQRDKVFDESFGLGLSKTKRKKLKMKHALRMSKKLKTQHKSTKECQQFSYQRRFMLKSTHAYSVNKSILCLEFSEGIIACGTSGGNISCCTLLGNVIKQLYVIKVHEYGTNSLSITKQKNIFEIYSGGDDGQVCLVSFKSKGNGEVSMSKLYRVDSSVQGICRISSRLFFVSSSQRLYSFHPEERTEEVGDSHFAEIFDPQGVHCYGEKVFCYGDGVCLYRIGSM